MKRATILMLFTFVLLPCSAGAASIGIGAFGGLSAPVLQGDNGQGTLIGLRAPVGLIPLLTVEPYFAKISGGDKDQDIEGTKIRRSGMNVTGFGANVLLKFGGMIQFYPFAGIGSYKLQRTGTKDLTNTAYTLGFGLGISPLPKLSIHARGELAAAVDGETSRKWANATVGVSYNIFSTPIP
jgi:hypothetical protein